MGSHALELKRNETPVHPELKASKGTGKAGQAHNAVNEGTATMNGKRSANRPRTGQVTGKPKGRKEVPGMVVGGPNSRRPRKDREFFISQPARAMLALSCNFVAFHNALARAHPKIAG